MPEKKLTLKLLKERLGLCRLNKSEMTPVWAKDCDFYSITKTFDELSIVCSQDNIPSNIRCEKDWRALKVEREVESSLIGILSSISTILSQKGISVFAVSTFETDYVLVKERDLANAIRALSNEKYEIIY